AGAVTSCADAPEAETCLLGDGETATYRLPQKALEGRAEGQNGQVFIVVLAADTSKTSVADCARRLAADGVVPEGGRIAAKRIIVAAAPGEAAPVNPTVTSLSVTGAAVAVEVTAGAGAQLPFLSWFVTAGELDDFRTDAVGTGLMNNWTPPEMPGT